MHALPIFLLAAAGLSAQVINEGSFLGVVKDSSGSVVPGASVRVVRNSTELRRQITTNGEGSYELLNMPIGDYRFEFEKDGFRKVVRTGISLSAGQSLRVDCELTVGSVTDSVTVNAQAAEVDPTTANVGNTVFASQVTELALSWRSFTDLAILEPGVLSNESQATTTTGQMTYSFNGGNQSSNNWMLDGGRNQDTYDGSNPTLVNMDAIAEVHIERNAYSAEFGRDEGAQINVIIRSGSNSFHGGLFEFLRNDKMDARNFFSTTKPEDKYNNFGGTVGGPIKKDKVFFFLSNEYRQIEAGTVHTTTVPTSQQVAGIFTGGSTIKDPLTGQPFPNNVIPTSRLDPNAVSYLQTFYPPPTPGYQQGALNFTSAQPDFTHYRGALGKLDYNISPTLTLAGHFNIDNTPYSTTFGTSSVPVVTAVYSIAIFKTASAALNWTIKPTLLNELTIAAYHGDFGEGMSGPCYRANDPKLNIPRYYNTVTDASGLIPAVSLSGYASLAMQMPQNITMYSFEARDRVSWVLGRHTVTFGGGIDRETKTQDQKSANNNGSFSFNGSYTGNAVADMMLGDAYSYTEASAHILGTSQYNEPSLYVQDRFRVLPRLTLTYGVHWEYMQPERDYAGTMAFFDPSLFNFSQAAVVQSNGQIVAGTQNPNNGMVQVGKNAVYGYALTNASHDTFDPRGGFSYAVTKDNKTVLRGGFGTFHDRWVFYASTARTNPPLDQSISVYNTNFSHPTTGQFEYFPGTLTNFYSPWQIPYMEKWSLDVQRELPAGVLLDVGYVGTRGIHQIRSIDVNQPVASVAVASGQVSANAVRPYPGFAAINDYETNGNTRYNSLQVSLVKRFAHGLSIQSAYTYSKLMDDVTTPPDSYAASQPNWGLAGSDRTHASISSVVWEVPFSAHLTGWEKRVFDGWGVSSISSFESGNPFSVGISSDRAGTGDGSERANVLGPVQRLRTLSEWFTTSAFVLPALGTFGNSGRDIIRAPGIDNWDVCFFKKTQLREKVALQFRAEFYNLFNHAQFSGVGGTFGTSTFGEVTSARNPRMSQLALRLLF
jgi:hypothetical protein